MAERYQDRPYPADDGYDRGDDQHAPGRAESDPLAELARLIGQTDPFANAGSRTNPPPQPRTAQPPATQAYYPPVEADNGLPAGPPPWMQRAARQEAAPPQDDPQDDYPTQDYPSAEHPLRRYAAQHLDAPADYGHPPSHAEVDQPLDPSRYDDALFGQLDQNGQHGQHDPAYSDEAYAYQDGYDDGAEEPAQKRRGGLTTVLVILALAVVGTGGAYAYRTYLGPSRSGEPPIIKADTSPTKTIPAPSDPNAKMPDRLAAGDGTEKIVPREEAPVDVNANTRNGPRMVFPALNQNANPPSPASVAPNTLPPANAANGTMPNNQPRAIKTFTVRGDQPDSNAVPVGTPPSAAQPPAAARPIAPARAAATPRTPPVANANASANAPLSLSPQAAQQPAPEPRTHVANNTPVQIAPAGPAPAGGGYLVQVSSQKNEADAQASYRVLQGKFPGVLGAHTAVIKRADLGEKGVYYRAMVGPFGSSEEASQFCGNLKSAGGQCVIQRN
jgi:hypothetical protein